MSLSDAILIWDRNAIFSVIIRYICSVIKKKATVIVPN